MLAHASKDVINHLETIAMRIKIVNNVEEETNVFKIHEYETCALVKMHRIVSQSSAKEETSDKFFFESYNNDYAHNIFSRSFYNDEQFFVVYHVIALC
jgi:hypothetical protein